jgi:hypothetical protein
MTEELTDLERRALGWLRDGDERGRRIAPALRDALKRKGLIDVWEEQTAERGVVRWAINRQGLDALEPRQPG